jgi:preprotein translocase subunit SecG
MYTFLLILFIANSVALMLVVLMQSSKGGGLGGAFGGGGGQAVFGGRGAAPFLSKLTTYLAGGYFVLALLLGIVSARGRSADSVLEDELAGLAGQLTNPGVPVSSALEDLSADSIGGEPEPETSDTVAPN